MRSSLLRCRRRWPRRSIDGRPCPLFGQWVPPGAFGLTGIARPGLVLLRKLLLGGCMVDLTGTMTQTAFGDLVGISQQAVSDLLRRDVITAGDPARAWLQSYCTHLREQAAGRAAAGDLDLAGERAALARVQRERIEMQNAVTRRELAPVSLLEFALAAMAQKVAGILEAIP